VNRGVMRACPAGCFAVVHASIELHPAPDDSMTINPNQIAALLVAAVLGNALLLRLWWRPPVAGKRVGRSLVNDLLLILFPLALFFAGWEMYWSRFVRKT